MSTKHWMQGAVKHPGALRNTAAKEGGIDKATGDIKASWLNKHKNAGGILGRRIALAKTFRKFSGRKKKKGLL